MYRTLHAKLNTAFNGYKDDRSATNQTPLKRNINISLGSRTSLLIYVTRPLRIVFDRPKMDEPRIRVIESGGESESWEWDQARRSKVYDAN